jgi:pyridoxine/pyridoxamine 5'-phosphate oxidase
MKPFIQKYPEPNAMTVATVASNMRPSTRVVLIKGYSLTNAALFGTPTTTVAKANSCWQSVRCIAISLG